tara:strand:+ start:387 stop:890 length:504 start_codon:yes stop_codon:yes gene_type:complete
VTINVDRRYLEIKNIKELIEVNKPNKDSTLDLVDPPDFQLNRFFYKQIGKNHKWIDRLVWTDKDWINYINNLNVKTYILKEKKELVGYFELIINNNLDCEIAYLGILENYFNRNYGGFLLSEAIKKSFILGVKRVWVHTCSLDHEHALKNYLSRGMKVFKSETITVY